MTYDEDVVVAAAAVADRWEFCSFSSEVCSEDL